MGLQIKSSCKNEYPEPESKPDALKPQPLNQHPYILTSYLDPSRSATGELKTMGRAQNFMILQFRQQTKMNITTSADVGQDALQTAGACKDQPMALTCPISNPRKA